MVTNIAEKYKQWTKKKGTDAMGETPVVTTDGTEAVEMQAEATETTSHAEFEQLKGERDGLLDRLARMQAEFDNARKREAKERADFRDYAVGNAAESFLGVLDNLQLALASTGSAEQFRSGVELIAKQLDEAVRGLGVVPVETVGSQFDPRMHEALGTVETKEFPDGAVVDEVRRGYRIKERLLRPALVRVASNPDVPQA